MTFVEIEKKSVLVTKKNAQKKTLPVLSGQFQRKPSVVIEDTGAANAPVQQQQEQQREQQEQQQERQQQIIQPITPHLEGAQVH